MTNSPLLQSEEKEDQQQQNQLFSYKLISSDVQETLPEGYIIRPLQRDDYEKGM